VLVDRVVDDLVHEVVQAATVIGVRELRRSLDAGLIGRPAPAADQVERCSRIRGAVGSPRTSLRKCSE
jgi:hypothetical protein